jgi:DNA-binding transcriptional regulator LsrR (DeoR family)
MSSRVTENFEELRLISRVIVLYYQEGLSQSEIGAALGLSTSKVNRLIKKARQEGMVEIHIRAPFQQLFELERQIEKACGVNEAIIVPELSQGEESVLQSAGKAAANYLLDHLRPGDTVCMGGGRALLELVKAIRAEKTYDVCIVPAIGGVQGTHYTDVNYLAAELARRIGGTAFQLHAPAFVDSHEERESLFALRHVQEVLDRARQAQIALVGIGSLVPETSSYFQFTSLSKEEIPLIAQDEQGAGEILARAYNLGGEGIARAYADRVVGLSLTELRAIPHRIGVAATPSKVPAITGALRGGWINTIVTDESAATEVCRFLA